MFTKMDLFLVVFLSHLFALTVANGPISDYCPYPFERNRTQVSIELSFLVTYLVDYKDLAGKLECLGIVKAKWYDPCGWQLAQVQMPETTAIANRVRMESKYFWSPSISQDYSLFQGQVFGHSENIPVDVYQSGYIEFSNQQIWPTLCQTEFEKFPFDQHQCGFDFCLWYDNRFVKYNKVVLDLTERAFDVDSLLLFGASYQPATLYNRTWQCGDEICSSGCAQFLIDLKRKWFPFYFHGIFLPMLMLSLLQLSAFLLPYQKPERFGFSATILLSNAMIISQVVEYTPQTAKHIILVTSVNISTLLGMSSTIFFVVIYSLRKRFKVQYHLKIHRISIAVFVTAYFLLYFGTFLAIAF